jgi:hypothetical protein
VSELTKVTIDHDEIRRWAEERGGKPAHVKGTGENGDPGILRIEFPSSPYAKDENLEPISSDEWLRKFDQQELAFVYEERTADGQISYFNKLVSRGSVEDQLEEAKSKSSGSRRTSTGRGSSRGETQKK